MHIFQRYSRWQGQAQVMFPDGTTVRAPNRLYVLKVEGDFVHLRLEYAHEPPATETGYDNVVVVRSVTGTYYGISSELSKSSVVITPFGKHKRPHLEVILMESATPTPPLALIRVIFTPSEGY